MKRLLGIGCLAALTGCAAVDPTERDGLWRPTGANETNLRVMVAVPSDLVQGVETASSDGHRAARAVERLRADRVYPLPDSTISKVGRSEGSAPGPAAGAAE